MAATVEGIIERRELAIRDEYNSGLTNMVGIICAMCNKQHATSFVADDAIEARRRAELAGEGGCHIADFRKLPF